MRTRTGLSISTALGALLWVPGAFAQTAATPAPASADPTQNTARGPADGAGTPSEDIVVTAQKREQTLIDVPQSISVVSGATLETQQATNFQDYVKLVPGLQLNQAQAGASRLILRGVNTGGVASTVAVYIDDTPFGSSTGLANGAVLAGDFDTFDVARIEVLRGPQGTLYGANSLGGLLKFVTNEPDLEKVEGKVRGGVEATQGGQIGYLGNAVVNLPLGPTLALRASGYYQRYGGFIDSIGTAATLPLPTATDPAGTVTRASDVRKDIDGARTYGGRASLLFEPSDRFKLRVGAILQNIDANAPDEIESDPVGLGELYGRRTQSEFVPVFRDTAYRLYNATADWDFGFATLTSVTSYGTLTQKSRDDVTVLLNDELGGALGIAPDFALPEDQRQHKFTEEVRLASSKSAVFDWLVGGYYTRETAHITQDYKAFNPGTLTEVSGLPLLAHVELPSVYREYAAFANGTVYFGPHFDLTLGGRYSHNAQHASQSNDGILAGAATGPITYPTTHSTDNVFTYQASPKFNFSKHASIYARVSKGYRPGGPNVLPAGATADTPRTYNADTNVSYEGGFKAETADGMLSVDLSGFHIDWRHIQLLAVVNDFGININGGKAQSDGAEFTLTARPTPGLTLTANGAITHARLKTDTSPFVGGFAGDTLPYTPRYSINLDGEYQWRLGGELKPFVGASLRSQSNSSGDYDYAYRTTYGHQRRVPAYEVVDVRAGVDFGKYSLEVYAKNLNNALARTSVPATFPTPSDFPNGAIGTAIIRPRTVGLSLTAAF